MRLAQQLVGLFPKHSLYVSPFVGTASEFAFKEPCRREIIGDKDENVYSVFAVLRDNRLFKRLIHLLENSNDSRRLYEESFGKLDQKNISILERAYRFLIVGNLGYQGRHPLIAKSYSTGLPRKRRLATLLPAVHAWRDRMRLVECENRDAIELIDMYDSPDTFMFLDPPYHEATRERQLYVHDTCDHRQLVKRLQRLQGRAMLCGYRHGLYDTQLLGWRRVAIPMTKCFGRRVPRSEIVWMNYDENGDKLTQDLELIEAFERLPA